MTITSRTGLFYSRTNGLERERGRKIAIAALHVAGNTTKALGYCYVLFNIQVHK
jgi:hypothetical protein